MESYDSSDNNYKAKTWFQVKCDNPQTRDLWIKARILYTFTSGPITALYLFDRAIPKLEQGSSRTSSQRSPWSRRVHYGIRILFDRIVTRWKPYYLSQAFGVSSTLHNSLTPEDLLSVPQIFGNISLKNVKL
jgi:hypothetical protein